MKLFNIPNYAQLNMELVIAGVTYVEDDFEADAGLSSVRLKGDINLFNALRTATTIAVKVATYEFETLYVKHPVSFDGTHIDLGLDSEPASKDVAYTTTDGVALPYAFGKPHVKAPKVSVKTVGVITESQYSLSIQNIASIFDAYQSAVPALAQASLFGLDIDRATELQAIQTFYRTISNLQDLVPSKADTLEQFYAMVGWRGKVHSSHHGTDSEGRYVYFKNAGLPPPISMYTMLQFDANDDVDDATNTEFDTSISDSSKSYYNHMSGSQARYSQLQSYYLSLVNELMQIPDVLKIELPNAAAGEVTLKIQGLIITGNYDGVGSLTVTSRAPEAVEWNFVADAGFRKVSAPSAATRDLTGKYVKIQVPSAVYSGSQVLFTGVVKVISQDGAVLELDMLPFENFASNTNFNASQKIYAHGTTNFCGLLRWGTIIAISDTVAGAQYDGQPFIYAGNYTWPDATLVEVPAYYIEARYVAFSVFSPSGPEDLNAVVYYKDYKVSVEKYYNAFVVTASSFGGDPTESSKAAYTYNFMAAEFNWNVEIGSEIEVDVDYKDIFVADTRPNMPILGVKAKVGSVYSDVDSSLYSVIPEYAIDGQLVTAVKLNFDLKERRLSNDIVVQVDSSQYTVPAILAPLAAKLGVGYSDSGDFTASPNFAVYGFTPVSEVIEQVVEQAKGGMFYSFDTLKVKNLAVEPAAVDHTFDLDNIDAYTLDTSDYLDILHNTLFSWEGLLPNNEVIVTLNEPPETLAKNSKKSVTIFDDSVQAVDFARWHVHRFGRDWMSVTIDGFVTALHLEAYDTFQLQLKGLNVRGEIQSVEYDHEGAAVKLVALLETTAESLWSVGLDVTTPTVDSFSTSTSTSVEPLVLIHTTGLI